MENGLLNIRRQPAAQELEESLRLRWPLTEIQGTPLDRRWVPPGRAPHERCDLGGSD